MFKYDEIKEYTIEGLKERADWYSDYGCDLHNELFNTDYYIIGTYRAKEWLSDSVFDVIGEIREYEEFRFGESITDLSSPEAVVNMYVYIIGEQILSESDHLTEEAWDRKMTPEDFTQIIEELD